MTPVDVVREAPCPFVLLDGISRADATGLAAWRESGETPFWMALEAAAQAAALHQRRLADFGAHAFLLSLGGCRWCAAPFPGRLELHARLLGRSAGAAAYDVTLCPEHAPALSLSVHIGLTPYDDVFRRELLQERYRTLWEKLAGPVVRGCF